MRTKDQLKREIRQEKGVSKRLVERISLAQDNLLLSQDRIAKLKEELKTAPVGWKGFF